ncbi:MAG: hypothetical protein HQM06_14775 [Magnetococcales bacterium]|nr:hypothetical protein [Magnetococcales bacterium]
MNTFTFAWQDKFLTGNEDVDFQHHFFLNLINRIGCALVTTQNAEYQEAILEELLLYAEFHFISEENIAHALQLPLLSQHKQRHLELLAELRLHIRQLHDQEMGKEQFVFFLNEWFAGHTLYEDKKMFHADRHV